MESAGHYTLPCTLALPGTLLRALRAVSTPAAVLYMYLQVGCVLLLHDGHPLLGVCHQQQQPLPELAALHTLHSHEHEVPRQHACWDLLNRGCDAQADCHKQRLQQVADTLLTDLHAGSGYDTVSTTQAAAER